MESIGFDLFAEALPVSVVHRVSSSEAIRRGVGSNPVGHGVPTIRGISLLMDRVEEARKLSQNTDGKRDVRR